MDRVRNFLSMMKRSLHYEVSIHLERKLAVSTSVGAQLVPINDAFGPSTYEPDIQAIIVSSETLKGGVAGKVS